MAHFVRMNGSICAEVIVINNEALENKEFPESEPIGIALCKSIYGADTEWLQTSYNGNFRGRYGGTGLVYNTELDLFTDPVTEPTE